MTKNAEMRESAVMMSSASAVDEVFLLWIAAHVLERHHGDGGFVRQCRCGKGRGRDRHDQAIAAPVPGFDIARFARVVVERPPQLLDAARKCLVAHRALLPRPCRAAPAW